MGVYYTLYNETQNHVVKGYWKGCQPTTAEVGVIARSLGWNLDRDRIVANSDNYSYIMKKVKLPKRIEYLNCFVTNYRWKLYNDDYGNKVDEDNSPVENTEYYSFVDHEIRSIERTNRSFIL